MSTAEQNPKADYTQNVVFNIDNAIAVVRDIRELPIDDGELRMDAFVLLYCRQGKVELDVNAKPYKLQTNQVFVLRPHDVVSNLMFSHNFDGSAMALSDEAVKRMVGENGMWRAIFYFADAPIITVSEERKGILQEYGRLFKHRVAMGQTPFRKEIIMSIVLSMLLEIFENIKPGDRPAIDENVRSKDLLFRTFISIISGCSQKRRAIAWYSDQLNVTSKYLSTVCKQVSGKTASEWINHYVAIDIRNLLKNTHKPIKEVVYSLGFPNISFFGSYCRRHFGMSPVEYRNYLRAQESYTTNDDDHEQNNC